MKQINKNYFKNLKQEKGKLNYNGNLPGPESIFILIVGSRSYSQYGKEACQKIIQELRGIKELYILSGLAIGIDELAHKFALENNIKTIAIPGSGLDADIIYPRKNKNLAENIIKSGGCLLSEFENNFKAQSWSFPKRNLLMAKLADIIIIIEAKEKSGTLITAKFGIELNKDVGIIPGSILSGASQGSNKLIKEGAYLIESGDDILEILNIKRIAPKESELNLNQDEKMIFKLLETINNEDELLEKSKLEIHRFLKAISTLEIKGLIQKKLGLIKKNF